MGYLTTAKLKKIVDAGNRGKFNDGNGLYLHVLAKKAIWRYDYQLAGKRKTLTFGS